MKKTFLTVALLLACSLAFAQQPATIQQPDPIRKFIEMVYRQTQGLEVKIIEGEEATMSFGIVTGRSSINVIGDIAEIVRGNHTIKIIQHWAPDKDDANTYIAAFSFEGYDVLIIGLKELEGGNNVEITFFY